MNAVFAQWARDGLVWLPERGMGWLNVTEAPYDAAYFDKYRAYADTEMGRAITATRVALVRRHAPRDRVCDVGIGCGSFVEAMDCEGFDVNPAGVRWLNDRLRFCDPREQTVDAATFWDVLEHIAQPAAILDNVRKWVFVSLPIVPGDGPPPLDWKHLRRDEHCLYWTRAGLIAWMGEHGFECIEHNTAESLLGRDDAHTFVFRRS